MCRTGQSMGHQRQYVLSLSPWSSRRQASASLGVSPRVARRANPTYIEAMPNTFQVQCLLVSLSPRTYLSWRSNLAVCVVEEQGEDTICFMGQPNADEQAGYGLLRFAWRPQLVVLGRDMRTVPQTM